MRHLLRVAVEGLQLRFRVRRQEVILMAGLEHPNLVMLKGMCLDNKLLDMLMITEYVPLGDLYQYLRSSDGSLGWDLIVSLFPSLRHLGQQHRAHSFVMHNPAPNRNRHCLRDGLLA